MAKINLLAPLPTPGSNRDGFAPSVANPFFHLRQPVGNGQVNDRQDVITMETIMGNMGALDLSATGGPTGFWGADKDRALRDAQNSLGETSDGVAKPGGPTITAMSKQVGNLFGGLTPATPEQVDAHHGDVLSGGSGSLNLRPPRASLVRAQDAPAPNDMTQIFNRQTVDAMTRSSQWGDIPKVAALEATQNGLSGAHDLVAQTHDRMGRTAADRLVHSILPYLPPALQQQWTGQHQMPPRPIGIANDQLAADDHVPLFRPTPEPVSAPEENDQNPLVLSAIAPTSTATTESISSLETAQAPEQAPTAAPSNQVAQQPAKEVGKSSLPPPTTKPIDPQALYEQLGYQHDGRGDYGNLIRHPLDGMKANKAGEAAIKIAQSEYGKGNRALEDGEGDAFRHALWAYMMAKEIGDDAARIFGDGHERNDRPDGERLMDLYNNAIGRELAADSRNKNRPDEEVIREAIKAGRLQTKPFNIPGPMGGGLAYRPRH